MINFIYFKRHCRVKCRQRKCQLKHGNNFINGKG
jgi:hypothetical protein